MNEEGIEDLNVWFRNSIRNQLENLYLEGDGDFGEFFKVQSIIQTLKYTLKHITNSITFSKIHFDQKSLILLFENGWHIPTISLRNWKLGYLEPNFKIKPKWKIWIKTLDLFGTLYSQNEDYIDEEKFEVLLEELKNNGFNSVIENLITNDEKYSVDKIESLLESINFGKDMNYENINVIAGKIQEKYE